MSQSEMNESSHPETGLKHGQFYVYQRNTDGKTEKVLVSPLSQEDIAEGWSLVLPRAHKNSTTHHFSVYLSQLPPHLWNRVYENEDTNTYDEITDNIYTYSVKMSKHDDEIRRLKNLVMAKYPNVEEITKQFKVLQTARVKGWVMTRAHHIMHPSKNSNPFVSEVTHVTPVPKI
jgi:hypothetical protein